MQLQEPRTLYVGFRRDERRGDGDRNSYPRVKGRLLRHTKDLRPVHEHEWRIKRLHPELARELHVWACDVTEVVRVATCDEEVALRRERDARVVHPRDVRRRHARVRDGPSGRSGV